MLSIDPYLLLLLVACVFILGRGALSFIRREGLSVQFALEAAGVTVLFVGGLYVAGFPAGSTLVPFVFLGILYAVTMRSRLAVGLANQFAGRGSFDAASRLYRLALAWWPEPSSRLIVLTNRGAAELRSGQVDAAILTLENVLETEGRAPLSLTCEAACRYNLAFAYEKKGEDAKSVAQYNEAIDVMPGSLYAQAAQAALKRRKRQGSGG